VNRMEKSDSLGLRTLGLVTYCPSAIFHVPSGLPCLRSPDFFD